MTRKHRIVEGEMFGAPVRGGWPDRGPFEALWTRLRRRQHGAPVLRAVLRRLRMRGVTVADGLTDAELEAAEQEMGCVFPPDLRQFLSLGLPIGDGWPDWRHRAAEEADEWTRDRDRSFRSDVEGSAYWLPSWGPRPEQTSAAQDIAVEAVSAWPPLIRVYKHRYLPSEPNESGNPVLSFAQPSDTIVYGIDLVDYFDHEFSFGRSKGARPDGWRHTHARRVPHWSTAFNLDDD